MDDSFPVSGSQPAGHLFHDVDSFSNVQFAPLLQDPMEVLALQVLHSDELGSPGFPDIENADDIPVSDLAREDQLLFEALQNFRVLSHFRLDHFERDLSLKLDVSSLVNSAHATFAKQLQNFIASAQQITNLHVGRTGMGIGNPGGRRIRSRRGCWSNPLEINNSGPLVMTG